MQLPALVIVQQHFTTHRSLAVGIASAGAGLGSFIWPAIIRYFLEQFALRGTVLLMGGIFLHSIAFAALYIPPKGKRLTSMNLEKASNSLFFGSTVSMPSLYQKKFEVDEGFGSQAIFLSRKLYQNIIMEDPKSFEYYYKGHSQDCVRGQCLQEGRCLGEKTHGCSSENVQEKQRCSSEKYLTLVSADEASTRTHVSEDEKEKSEELVTTDKAKLEENSNKEDNLDVSKQRSPTDKNECKENIEAALTKDEEQTVSLLRKESTEHHETDSTSFNQW